MADVSSEIQQIRENIGAIQQALGARVTEVAALRQQVEATQNARGELEQLRSQIGQLEQELAQARTRWVRQEGGQELNRREAPGLGSKVLDTFAIGTQVTLWEGPRPADGFTWWRVQANDGREGWVAGEELGPTPS